MPVYRTGAKTPEKDAIDAIEKGADSHRVIQQLDEQMLNLMGAHGFRSSDRNGMVIGVQDLQCLVKDKPRAARLIQQLHDMDTARLAVRACATTGEQYWTNRLFQDGLRQLNEGQEYHSRTQIVRRLIENNQPDMPATVRISF